MQCGVWSHASQLDLHANLRVPCSHKYKEPAKNVTTIDMVSRLTILCDCMIAVSANILLLCYATGATLIRHYRLYLQPF